MKKFLKFGTLLTKEEAKKVRGGKNCPVCDCYPCICPDGGDGGSGGTCGWRDDNGYGQCGLTKAEAMFMAEGIPGRHWCCESCASNGGNATYC